MGGGSLLSLFLFCISGEVVNTHGPVEPDKDNIRQEPYTLPQGFMWDALDLGDRGVVSRDKAEYISPRRFSLKPNLLFPRQSSKALSLLLLYA